MPTDEKPPRGGEPDSSSAVSGDASPDDQSSAPDGHPDDQDDFSRLLDESFEVVSFEVGQSVEGEIVALDADGAFIDIGGKGEATIDLSELANDDGDVEEKVGDRVKAVVVSTRGGLKLSRKLARGAAAKTQLDAAFRSGMPVEGRVEAVNKGGYEVRIAGQRAFCPLSQMDTVRGTEPAEYVGKVHAFRIVEWKAGGKDLVVSRRALLEAEATMHALAEVLSRGPVLNLWRLLLIGHATTVP